MRNAESRPPVGAVLALAVLAASFSSIFIRFAQSEATSLVISAYRMAVAALLLSPILLLRHKEELRKLPRDSRRLSLLAGAAAGAGYVIVGRRVRQTVSLVPYIGIAYGAAAIALILASLFQGAPLFGFEPTTYLWLLLLAVFPQLIAHTSYNWALGYVAAAIVSLVLLAEPVASGVLALVFLDETPTTLRLVGGALILIGIGLGTVRSNSSRSDS